MFKMIDKKAFTLAEVLVTLTIIGVVAALLWPSIVASTQRKEVETGLVVVYNALENALKVSETKNGSRKFWVNFSKENLEKTYNNTSKSDGATEVAEEFIIPFLNYSKYEKGKTLNDLGYKTGITRPGGSTLADKTEIRNMLQLSNGVTIIFEKDYFQFKIGNSLKSSKPTGLRILVDLNGPQKPNSVGEDIFSYTVMADSAHKLEATCEYTIDYDGYNTDAQKVNYLDGGKYKYKVYSIETLKSLCESDNQHAYCCAAYIKASGWKIPKDYPWI